MDERIALAPSAVLKLKTDTGYTPFIIRHEVGRGGSCIVYDASYNDHLGNFKLVRIKECYPHAIRITRNADGKLTANPVDSDAFAAAKKRMTDAYQRNHDLFCISSLANSVANTSDIYEANGTLYIVSVYMNGKTFADFHGNTLHDCVSLLISIAGVLQRIHDAGYLYLDLKPDNILILEGSLDLVQLFDFDSMISMKELTSAVQSGNSGVLRPYYTRGYAPLEQQTGKLRQLGKQSDIYSLGAVLFYALWHKTPSAFDCASYAEYDYAHMTYAAKHYQDQLFPALTSFLHRTLASYHADRYQSMEEALCQLQAIRQYSDETKRWLLSTPVSAPAFFTGREKELSALEQLLHTAGQHTFHLYGMGGIGKSTLVRAYLSAHRTEYDAVLWLCASKSAAQLLCDDSLVCVNTVRRMHEESLNDYLERKIQALKEMAASGPILVVVDNVHREFLEELHLLQDIGWDLLLISRPMLAEGLFPALGVEAMSSEALMRLFRRFSRVDMTSEEEQNDFLSIANKVYGHTLTVELLGRQIARSYLTLHEAAQLVENAGFEGFFKEPIDYIHDEEVFMAPLCSILDRLIEIDRFSDDEKKLLQILSIFEEPSLRISLLRELITLPNLEMVNRMEEAGWLEITSGRIRFHPMLREYVRSWHWNQAVRESLDEMMERLHRKINPMEEQPDLDKQFPADYGQLYELLGIADQLLSHADPTTPASQLLTFRMLMDSPVDADEAVTDGMIHLLECADGLPSRCILRLYETTAFMLGRMGCYEDAHDLLKEMKVYLKKHPSHYYASWYHRATAVILNNQYGCKKNDKCIKHENAAIKEARRSNHPDAPNQLAAVLLNKTQTLLESRKKMSLCGQMLAEAGAILQSSQDEYERYHFECVASMYFAIVGDREAALKHLQRATEHAETEKDSPLALIEHMLDETAAVYIQLGQLDDAIATVLQAIAMCDANEKIQRYRKARFEAYLFLGTIYALNNEFIQAEATFQKAEMHLEDSDDRWNLPLCPKEIREKAEEERMAKR